MLRVLSLPLYGRSGASSRLRFYQYYPWLDEGKISIITSPLFSDDSLRRRYLLGRYRLIDICVAYIVRIFHLVRAKEYDLLWIEKEALPWFPVWLELALINRIPFVLDFDDATFHRYDLHSLSIIRSVFGTRVDSLMSMSHVVIVGNSYLGRRAFMAGAQRIEYIPTVIDLTRYSRLDSTKFSGIHKIVWIGSPSTVRYLLDISPALITLARKFQFTLRVIGANIDIQGLDIECVSWSEDTEVLEISQCDIGIMPLADSPWELGKCGYKLIQYMACGLPVVASPIGFNLTLVRHGINGFFGVDLNGWVDKVAELLSNQLLRRHMGSHGRKDVSEFYNLQRTAPKMLALLKSISNPGH